MLIIYSNIKINCNMEEYLAGRGLKIKEITFSYFWDEMLK
jgi:hypothetical protein